MFGWSFVFVGAILVLFSLSAVVTKKIRVFYGIKWEGRRAVVLGVVGLTIGIIVICFGVFVVPSLVQSFFE